MRIAIILLMLLLAPLQALADDDFNDQLTQALNENIQDVQILGVLKFCEKPGLREPIYQKIAYAITAHATGNKAIEMLQIVDAQSNGVEMGLRIAKLDPAAKGRVCDFAISYVDSVMSKQVTGNGP